MMTEKLVSPGTDSEREGLLRSTIVFNDRHIANLEEQEHDEHEDSNEFVVTS